LFAAQLPHLLIFSPLRRSIRRAEGRGKEDKKLHRTTVKNSKDEQGTVSWNETFVVDLSGESELRLVLKRALILPFESSKTCLPHVFLV
jgi:hypothetical protein